MKTAKKIAIFTIVALVIATVWSWIKEVIRAEQNAHEYDEDFDDSDFFDDEIAEEFTENHTDFGKYSE